MAVGDVVSAHSSVSASGYLDIQPSAGAEWVIHNLYYGGSVEVYRTDGTNQILIDSDSGPGCRMGTVFHVTNTHYLSLKNTGASA